MIELTRRSSAGALAGGWWGRGGGGRRRWGVARVNDSCGAGSNGETRRPGGAFVCIALFNPAVIKQSIAI